MNLQQIKEKMQWLKSQTIEAIQEYFRHSEFGEYEFTEAFPSAENDEIMIHGIRLARENGDVKKPVFIVYGYNEDGTDIEDDLDTLSQANLISILEELEQKKIQQVTAN